MRVSGDEVSDVNAVSDRRPRRERLGRPAGDDASGSRARGRRWCTSMRRAGWSGIRSWISSPREHTIYAPLGAGDDAAASPTRSREVDDLWDLVIVYDELIRARYVDVDGVPLIVGQSFGGHARVRAGGRLPGSVCSRLVLLDPIGLWLDDHPVQLGGDPPQTSRRCCSTTRL